MKRKKISASPEQTRPHAEVYMWSLGDILMYNADCENKSSERPRLSLPRSLTDLLQFPYELNMIWAGIHH